MKKRTCPKCKRQGYLLVHSPGWARVGYSRKGKHKAHFLHLGRTQTSCMLTAQDLERLGKVEPVDPVLLTCDVGGEYLREDRIHIRNEEVVCGTCCGCGAEPCVAGKEVGEPAYVDCEPRPTPPPDWREYLVGEPPVCGLCGNSGYIPEHRVPNRDPRYVMPTLPCVCPTGRTALELDRLSASRAPRARRPRSGGGKPSPQK